MDFFQNLDWQSLLLSAAITTFIVSAINTVQSKLSSNWLVFIVAFVVTILNTTFTKGAHFAEWQVILSKLLFTMAFSVLFYNYLGKTFVDDFFAWLRRILQDKFQKATPPTIPTPPEIKP